MEPGVVEQAEQLYLGTWGTKNRDIYLPAGYSSEDLEDNALCVLTVHGGRCPCSNFCSVVLGWVRCWLFVPGSQFTSSVEWTDRKASFIMCEPLRA